MSDLKLYPILRQSEFFTKVLTDRAGLPLIDESELKLLAARTEIVKIAQGKTIFQQGDKGESAYIIVTGKVKGKVEYKEIAQAKNFEMEAGSLFGEISLMTGLPRTATTYTEQEVELVELSRQTFAHLLSLRSQIPEILSDLVVQRQKDDAKTLERLKAFNTVDIVRTQKPENILERFLGILIENNLIPKTFPKIFPEEPDRQQQHLVAQLQESEFCQRLLVNENGNSLLHAEELTLLIAKTQQVHFDREEIIFRQGEQGTTAYIILEGIVKGRVEYKENDPVKEFAMGKGVLFGEISVIAGIPRTATVYCDRPVEVLVLSEETFAYLLNLRPEIPEVLADLIAQRQEGDRAALDRLKHFNDRDIDRKLDRDTMLDRFQRMGLDVWGFYARAPYTVLNYLSQAASDRSTTETLASLYLTDNFAPVHRERTIDNLTVIGELPTELSGIFLRIGPNPQFPPLGRYHWFDGDGMIHAVEIDRGRARYRNRWVRTKGFKIERREGKAIWPGQLNMPRFDLPYGMVFKNSANTAMVWHAGKLLTLWEGGNPHIIDLPSLETIGDRPFSDKLTCAFTAHPKIDPVTGEMMFFGYSLMPPYLQYGIVARTGELLKIVPIDLPAPVLMHDFAITEHYTIFLDLPLTFQVSRVMQGEVPVVFEPDYPSRIGILPRYGDNRTIRWFEIPTTCMIYHTLNAYEEKNEIVLWAYRMPSTNLFIPEYDTGDPFKSLQEISTCLTCWKFNLKTGRVKEEQIDPVLAEFPQINSQRVGRKMRYAFASLGASYMAPKPLFDGVRKYDFATGDRQNYYFGRGRFGGECTFVSRPSSEEEDDGWLLTYIYDAIAKQSEMLVLSARDITAEPIAKVILPQRVPYGLHTAWVSSEQIEKPLLQ